MWHYSGLLALVCKATIIFRCRHFSVAVSSFFLFISSLDEVNSDPNIYISGSKYANIHAIKHNFASQIR